MKFNKWTVGLAAVGAVSLGSVVQAADPVGTLSSTTISGYVDTSMQWNLGTGDSHAPAYKYGGPSKADGFNLNAVKVTIEKPMDESEWAAGYKVDLFMGPDADTLGTQSVLATGKSDFALKQAYVALRAPVGNGIDFKVGVFDSIIGYESTESVNNPNFTRSWGHSLEPSTHTGILGTYRVCNFAAISAGIADTDTTFGPQINARTGGFVNGVYNNGNTGTGPGNESSKTYMGAIALTAPDNWGFLAGSSLYAGAVEGFDNALARQQQNYYLGATLATPVTGLRVGAAFDYVKAGNPLIGVAGPAGNTTLNARAFAAYASFQATEKLSVHGRFEYANLSPYAAALIDNSAVGGVASRMASTTATVRYDLWKNVLTRVEFRWDHALDGWAAFGGNGPGIAGPGASHYPWGGSLQNSYIIAANISYLF